MTEIPDSLADAYRRGDAYCDAYHALYVLVRTPGLADAERERRADEIHARLKAAREAGRSPEPVESRPHVNETSTGGFMSRDRLPGEGYRGATSEPRKPTVWRVDSVPDPDDEPNPTGWLYREDGGMWQVKTESGKWSLSGWTNRKAMQDAGYVLSEVLAETPGGGQ
jgi:hypothetical protein